MEFEIDVDKDEKEEYGVLDTIAGDKLYTAILLIMLKNKAFNSRHAIPTPNIYRAIRREIDRSAKYLQVWKRLYRLLECGIVERVEGNPVRWYIKRDSIDMIAKALLKQHNGFWTE
ncbi:MAG: hypothetical protein N3D82_01440 [Ignisphaera sp.]|nr:hypothetical protein [Ignisphaera sp.]MCX8167681.1 hypothetical protein [Ignisphaera sp.]MDW8085671.1 hypothetical protein [Ignisphaera sp.]